MYIVFLIEVTWGMRGKMPFFFRWMSKMMDGWVDKGYETGLAKLPMQSAADLYRQPFLRFG